MYADKNLKVSNESIFYNGHNYLNSRLVKMGIDVPEQQWSNVKPCWPRTAEGAVSGGTYLLENVGKFSKNLTCSSSESTRFALVMNSLATLFSNFHNFAIIWFYTLI